MSHEIHSFTYVNQTISIGKRKCSFFRILVETEPIADERLRTLVDEELKTFRDSTKTIEQLNAEFVKTHGNSLADRAEGEFDLFFFVIVFK